VEGEEFETYSTDAFSLALSALTEKYKPDTVLFGATNNGRDLGPKVACHIKTGLTADCTGLGLNDDGENIAWTRPTFGGNLMATIICPDRRPQMATVRPKVFPVPKPDNAHPWTLIREDLPEQPCGFEWLEAIASSAGADIGEADILVSVGQGIGGAENIDLARRLAQKLHGALSSSRPLVDNGIMPYPCQVGQTGKTVAPKLYLALGISGAIQHMAGVAAGTLVAVNTDPDAPICGYADYVIPCDCGVFLRSMLSCLA
jgi:electron transfer flavoprotein alpha subunit